MVVREKQIGSFCSAVRTVVGENILKVFLAVRTVKRENILEHNCVSFLEVPKRYFTLRSLHSILEVPKRYVMLRTLHSRKVLNLSYVFSVRPSVIPSICTYVHTTVRSHRVVCGGQEPPQDSLGILHARTYLAKYVL